ncbi:hypothetical protein [Peterkaempfera sp. SMS 1(5)a]|uniref:hypothetical protein n=1 Tax=Peterkaempfera podocarpi TaxID=3232308 RepID=UPI00366F02B4
MTCTARPILRTAAPDSDVALGVAGWSSGGSHADGTSTTQASAPAGASATMPTAAAQRAAPLTAAQPKGAALSGTDLPAGFAVHAAAEDDTLFASATDTAKPASSRAIADIAGDDGAIEPTGPADTDYLQTTHMIGLLFGHIAAYGASDAEKTLAGLRTALMCCTSHRTTTEADRTVTAGKTRVLPAPCLGNGAIAFEVTGTSGSGRRHAARPSGDDARRPPVAPPWDVPGAGRGRLVRPD